MTVYELISALVKIAEKHGNDVPVVICDADTEWLLNVKTVEFVESKKAVRCPTCSREIYGGECITPAHVFIAGDYGSELEPKFNE